MCLYFNISTTQQCNENHLRSNKFKNVHLMLSTTDRNHNYIHPFVLDDQYHCKTIPFSILCLYHPKIITSFPFCFHRYYSDRGTCAKCYLSCHTCSGPRRDQCVKCPNDWQLAGGECHPECPEGFFKTPFGCQKCHHYCKTCSGKIFTHHHHHHFHLN